MKLIIAGSRDCLLDEFATAMEAAPWAWDIIEPGRVEIVSGGARGVDLYAEEWADERNWNKKIFEAHWRVDGVYNPLAGFERNQRMADYLDPTHDALFSIWNGKSTGSLDMLKRAKKAKIFTIIYNYVTGKINDKL